MTQWNPNDKPTKFCVNCGAQIDSRAEICPKCGVRVSPPPPPTMTQQPYGYATQPPQTVFVERKNEGLAAILSFLFLGLGQIYNGQIGKGILFIILGVVFVVMFLIIIGIPLYIAFWAYNIYDAYNTAKQINAGYIKT